VAGTRGGHVPGILGLLELIEGHRPAFEYDWRTRFRLPLSDIGEGMTWGEALRHTITLSADPSSQVCVSINGLAFAASREYLALLTLNANYVARHTEKRARFRMAPDPFEAPPKRYGSPMSKAALRLVLDAQRALPSVEQAAQIIEGG